MEVGLVGIWLREVAQLEEWLPSMLRSSGFSP